MRSLRAASSNNFDAFILTVSCPAAPSSPEHQRHKWGEKEGFILIYIHALLLLIAVTFIHHFVCLLVFPFVRLLSILVVQRRGEPRALSCMEMTPGETLGGAEGCLMPGPPRRVGTPLLRNAELRREEKQPG